VCLHQRRRRRRRIISLHCRGNAGEVQNEAKAGGGRGVGWYCAQGCGSSDYKYKYTRRRADPENAVLIAFIVCGRM